jgi:nitroimidazol reductase NimA-like FMN-containing flavoprotein (pyridoxamine 5'-phosphate oxidase superfamily)
MTDSSVNVIVADVRFDCKGTNQSDCERGAMGTSNMNQAERERFLAAPHIGVISVNRADPKAPLATPVWYNYVPGGEVTVLIDRSSMKYQLILASGALTLTVQNERYPYGYVSVSGDVTFEESLNREAILALARRYRPESEAVEFADAQEDSTEAVFLRMRPAIWFGQDFTKS